MITSQMPRVNVDQLKQILTPIDFSITRRILVTSGEMKGQGHIRVSMPKMTEHDPYSVYAAYVWRLVRFATTPGAVYPRSAILMLPEHAPVDKLKDLVKIILNNRIPNPDDPNDSFYQWQPRNRRESLIDLYDER